MTFIPPGLSDALWRIVPAPLRSKLRSTVAKRFVRFAPAAVCAVAATQIVYIICLGPAEPDGRDLRGRGGGWRVRQSVM